MALLQHSECRKVHGTTEIQRDLIEAYIQGAVYCWVKNRQGEWFAARDLVGGENFDREGTPLYVLFQKHIDLRKDHESAVDPAGKDFGWLLKSVIAEDERTFKAGKDGLVSVYRSFGDEP